MPFGISSASEVQQKKAIQIFGDIRHSFLINDDMLLATESEEDHDQAVITVLEKARQFGIKFNPSKLQFKRKEVVYHGTKLSDQGIQANEENVKAIKEMPEPEDKKGVQRFLGRINHLSPFILHKASLTSTHKTRFSLELEQFSEGCYTKAQGSSDDKNGSMIF